MKIDKDRVKDLVTPLDASEIKNLAAQYNQQQDCWHSTMGHEKQSQTKADIRTVMLVDDNETDNFIHRRLIELSGFARNIIVRNSGKSALEFLAQNKDKPEDLPDIIFLDINMPIVDGFVFLFEYDSFPEEIKERCRIIILSSSDSERDIDRMVDNRLVNRFIVKPLTEEALLALRN